MTSSAERVSVFALARDIQNGGNTAENRQLALKLFLESQNNPNLIYKAFILREAVEAGWRRQGLDEGTVLDVGILFEKPDEVDLTPIPSLLKQKFAVAKVAA